MKRILFVTAALGYGIGGSEKALIEMLKCMDLKKYKITVLTLTEKPEKPFYWNGIDVVYGFEPLLRISKPLRYVLTHMQEYKVCELVTKIQIALKTRQTNGYTANYIWERYRKLLPMVEGKYDIVVGYGLGFATFFATDMVDADRRILWMDNDLALSNVDIEYNRKYYETADAVAVVDKSQISRLCDVYPALIGRVFAIRNIIPFDEIKEKARLGKGFEDEYNGIRILSVGRLSTEKNFSLAVDAASILKKKGHCFRWYIIGFGPLENELRQQITELDVSDCVILLGQKLNPYPYFAQTDLYVQTSIFEGSCITIEEAMVFCKPVVTTNFPPAYNKIIDGGNGYIVEMTPEAIADKIEKLLCNEEVCKKMIEYQAMHPLTYDEIMDAFDEMVESMGE